MKYVLIACMGALLGGLSSCSSFSGADRDGSGPERKSVLVGELLAIFPGLFVHGMGHRYAGNSDRADEILTMELYSLLTGGLGAGIWGIGEHEDADAVRITGYVGMGVGGVVFLGTWIYDIVYTPGQVEEYNRKLEENNSPFK